jgi:hypothetical protein
MGMSSYEYESAMKEYIALLEKELARRAVFSFTHGIRTDEADIKKGEELRNKIAQYEKEWKEFVASC